VFRKLARKKYDGSRRHGGGRPRTPDALAELVVRVALENVRFGYTRIRDTVNHLGHDLERSSVKRILDARGIVPAPERERTTTWRDFLRAHADTLCAADFFPVEILTRSGITRFQVLFVMHVVTRRVHIAGIARATDLNGAWMLQVARNLTDPGNGFLRNMRQLVLDRDPLFSSAFRELLSGAGVKVVRLPSNSPNLNAHAERWVRSCRAELLDRVLIFGEAHLRRLVLGYAAQHNAERPHQGLGGAFIEADPRATNRSGGVRREDRLGGLLRFYFRAAA
jgi:putative transposase